MSQTITHEKAVVTPPFQAIDYRQGATSTSKRAVQNALNDLALRTMKRVDIPNRDARTILAILGQIGHAEPGEVCHRSRLAIAQGLRVGGSIESQKGSVSKLLAKLRREQSRRGKLLVSIEQGNPEQSPGFVDHLGPLLEEADQRRRTDTRWRKGREGKIEATEAAVDWIISELPEAEPEKPTPEPSEPSLSELGRKWLTGLERGAESLVDVFTSREGSAEVELRSYLRQGERLLAQIEESLRKTERARAKAKSPAEVQNCHLSYESQERGGSFDSLPLCDSSSEGSLFEATGGQIEADLGAGFEAENGGGGVVADLPLLQGLTPLESTPILDFVTNRESETEAEIDPVKEALSALEVFRSVGCPGPLEVVFLDDSKPPDKKAVRVLRPVEGETEANIETWLTEAEAKGLSLALRMEGSGPERSRGLIQVDDANAQTVELLRPVAFLTIETSPGNYQVWLSVEVEGEAELTRLRGRLFHRLGARANGGAYGSLRFPGSRNFKPGRDGFRVRVINSLPGRKVTEAILEKRGLLGAAPAPKNATQGKQRPSVTHLWLPDYDRELQRFSGDRSKADAAFVAIILKAGWSEDEAVVQLEQVSEKAQKRRDNYAENTVKNVAAHIGVRD